MHRIAGLSALALGACVTLPTETGGSGESARLEIGLIAVRRSEPQVEPKAIVVSRIGGWASGSGVGLGYAKTKTIDLDGECRVVFLIENEDQLRKSIDLVKSTLDTGGGDICVTG